MDLNGEMTLFGEWNFLQPSWSYAGKAGYGQEPRGPGLCPSEVPLPSWLVYLTNQHKVTIYLWGVGVSKGKKVKCETKRVKINSWKWVERHEWLLRGLRKLNILDRYRKELEELPRTTREQLETIFFYKVITLIHIGNWISETIFHRESVFIF